MDLQLKGKRALVTGSNTGIGAAIAYMLAEHGVSVIVHGRNRERVLAVFEKVKETGASVAYVVGDLSTDEGAAAIAKEALDAFGGIDILVNTAGGRPGYMEDRLNWEQLTTEDWFNTYNMNVLSAVRMINLLVEGMKERSWGRVINISSLAGHLPSGPVPEYAAAKAALNSATIALSKVLSKTGVTANIVSPGMTRTDTFYRFLENISEKLGYGADREKGEEFLRSGPSQQTVDRLGEPADIAAAVCFLASPVSDFTNGMNLRVDGGASPAP